MQTPKPRTNSVQVPQKKSPGTTRTARLLKVPGSDPEAMSSSPSAANKTPKDKSPKVGERKSPRSPASEKKRANRIPELEAQLSQLREELKKAKDQLASSEAGKRQAQKEAEEAKYRLSLLSQKLGESQQQLMELSASENERLQELRKISQDRDRAWQSELEAVQKQQAMDSSALTSAMNEIKKLRVQLEKVAESEAAQSNYAELAHNEVQCLRDELSETLSLVEKLRFELNGSRESEAQAFEVARDTERQLEVASMTADTLRSECIKVSEAYDTEKTELERSYDRVKELEALVSKLQEVPSSDIVHSQAGEIDRLKDELDLVKNEAGQLRSALDAAEMRYQEEYIQNTMQIRTAYEQVENTKKESSQRQAALEEELKKAMIRIEELGNVSPMKLETESEIEEASGNEKEHDLIQELESLRANLSELKGKLTDNEAQLKDLSDENEALKVELGKREMETNKANGEAEAMEKAVQEEALTRVESLREEAYKSNKRVELVMEQLEAAQAANSEMEAELRRLKVQSDQWRKAAEAAAAMISSGGGNNGKVIERTGSLENYYSPSAGGNVMGSPYSEDMDEESMKKRNGNVLMKKIGVLWKKGQK